MINQYSLVYEHVNPFSDHLSIQHMESMNIHQCIDCWHQIFRISIILKITESGMTLKSSLINSCPFKVNNDLLRYKNNPQFIQLISFTDHTKKLLQQPQSQISQVIPYREILSLRRMIMIIHVYHKIDDKNTKYPQLLYIIHSIIEKYFKSSLLNKKYYNIHISKSGGTSICSTFNNLPFLDISTPDGAVCNYKWNDHKGSSCQEIYGQTKEYDMVAREVALDVFYDHKTADYHPKLCDNFIYLLPFRHPLEKAFSWSSGDNVLYHHYRTQFYRLIPKQHENEGSLPCLEKSIIIDGHVYRRITKGHHYQNFFGALFDSENPSQKPLNSWNQALNENVKYKSKSQKLNVTLPQCMHKDQQNQHWIYIFFNIEDKPGAPFMMKYRKSQWPFPGLRLPRSSAGNTWTSWLGYGDKSCAQ